MLVQKPALRLHLTRAVVAISLVLLPIYLGWRLAVSSRGAFVPLFVLLLVAELGSIVRYLAQVLPWLLRSPESAPEQFSVESDIAVDRPSSEERGDGKHEGYIQHQSSGQEPQQCGALVPLLLWQPPGDAGSDGHGDRE